jgi:hypothetical protein
VFLYPPSSPRMRTQRQTFFTAIGNLERVPLVIAT